ncbi:MAG: DUF4266 domain-containing protein [Pseudomonadota bacterium]
MITVSLLFSACTYVSPWEKGTLARQEMMLAPDPLEERLRDHVFYAKEASSSGSAVSGGGCGCN